MTDRDREREREEERERKRAQSLNTNTVVFFVLFEKKILQELNMAYSVKLLESQNAPAVRLNRCLDYATIHSR